MFSERTRSLRRPLISFMNYLNAIVYEKKRRGLIEILNVLRQNHIVTNKCQFSFYKIANFIQFYVATCVCI